MVGRKVGGGGGGGRSHAWHDLFIRDTWLMECMCDMTARATWLSHMCDMTRFSV